MPWPVRPDQVPPGAYVLGQDGVLRQGWHVPPDTLVLLDPDGSTISAQPPAGTLILIMVTDEYADVAQAIAVLSAVFGPVEQIPE